jgi:xanthine dehydrogenase accessory factor
MDEPRRVFRFMADHLGRGEKVALVTVVDVTGSSVRSIGTHMAVAACGDYIGSLSGGCFENAVVAEAQAAIAAGEPRLLHYGAGSPVIDIRLPCGGAVHLLVCPVDDAAWCACVLDGFARREAVAIELDGPGGERFNVRHAPPLRLAIFGYGAATSVLARLAHNMGADVLVWSPDETICAEFGSRATLLRTPSDTIDLAGDDWTAIAMLFHDHDWEATLLRQLLRLDSLSVAAMGSRATHSVRLAALTKLGVPDRDLARIKSPIGLIHASRDPDTLALSAFVEAVDAYNRTKPTECVQMKRGSR